MNIEKDDVLINGSENKSILTGATGEVKVYHNSEFDDPDSHMITIVRGYQLAIVYEDQNKPGNLVLWKSFAHSKPIDNILLFEADMGTRALIQSGTELSLIKIQEEVPVLAATVDIGKIPNSIKLTRENRIIQFYEAESVIARLTFKEGKEIKVTTLALDGNIEQLGNEELFPTAMSPEYRIRTIIYNIQKYDLPTTSKVTEDLGISNIETVSALLKSHNLGSTKMPELAKSFINFVKNHLEISSPEFLYSLLMVSNAFNIELESSLNRALEIYKHHPEFDVLDITEMLKLKLYKEQNKLTNFSSDLESLYNEFRLLLAPIVKEISERQTAHVKASANDGNLFASLLLGATALQQAVLGAHSELPVVNGLIFPMMEIAMIANKSPSDIMDVYAKQVLPRLWNYTAHEQIGALRGYFYRNIKIEKTATAIEELGKRTAKEFGSNLSEPVEKIAVLFLARGWTVDEVMPFLNAKISTNKSSEVILTVAMKKLFKERVRARSNNMRDKLPLIEI